MKNKSVTYLLLAVVAVVWGLIVWKIISHYGDEGTITAIQQSTKIDIRNSNHDSTYRLELNYPDPFLRGNTAGITERGNNDQQVFTNQQRSTTVRKIKVEKSKPVITPPEVIDWSFLKYIGLIGNRNSTQKIGLVTIHNKDHVIKEKEVFEGVSIVRIGKDSLYIDYKNQKHVYLRGK